jgi:hypothetical protein
MLREMSLKGKLFLAGTSAFFIIVILGILTSNPVGGFVLINLTGLLASLGIVAAFFFLNRFFPRAVKFLGGLSQKWQLFFHICIFSPILLVLMEGSACFFNEYLDFHDSAIRYCTVTQISSGGYRSLGRHLYFSDCPTVKLPANRTASVGRTVILTVKPGFFGQEWVKDLR